MCSIRVVSHGWDKHYGSFLDTLTETRFEDPFLSHQSHGNFAIAFQSLLRSRQACILYHVPSFELVAKFE